MTTLEECFDSFAATAFRLEARPAYAVASETERIEAFRRGLPRPERSVRTSPWLARIATTTVAGKHWQRVRVVSNPLTEYQRYQMASWVESQAAGEEVRIAPADHLARCDDFWLFDAGLPSAQVAVLRYDATGRYLGARITADPTVVMLREEVRNSALSRSVPLNEWLAAAGKASAAA